MVLPKKISYSSVADINAPVASSEQPENNITLSKVTAGCDTAVITLSKATVTNSCRATSGCRVA